jgi:hypothetical protein
MNNPKPAHPEPGPHERPALPALRSTRFPYTVRQTSATEADIYDAEGDFFVGGELEACNVIACVFNAAYAEQNQAYTSAASPSPAPDHHTALAVLINTGDTLAGLLRYHLGGKSAYANVWDKHRKAYQDAESSAVPAPSPAPTPDKD